jgi:7-cyano-7-deazaguanine reductase
MTDLNTKHPPVGPPELCSSPDAAAQKLLAEYRQTAAAGLRKVTLVCDEVSALCPLTKQPDQYVVTIKYEPSAYIVESKALKGYLQTYRNVGVLAETLSATVAAHIGASLSAKWVRVKVRQKSRGGISICAKSRWPSEVSL